MRAEKTADGDKDFLEIKHYLDACLWRFKEKNAALLVESDNEPV